MFRKEPEERLADIVPDYIKKVGINNVTALTRYLGTLKSLDPSIEFIYKRDKPSILSYIDAAFESVIHSEIKEIKEVTGDFDPIKDKRRQELYRKITNSSAKFQVLMNIEPWTLENAELLKSVGVDVRHNTVQEDYHFATWSNNMMFTLYREPTSKEAKKVVSEPQSKKTLEHMNYWFLATNQPDFVRYTNKLFDELLKKSHSFEYQKNRINKNRQNEELLPIA